MRMGCLFNAPNYFSNIVIGKRILVRTVAGVRIWRYQYSDISRLLLQHAPGMGVNGITCVPAEVFHLVFQNSAYGVFTGFAVKDEGYGCLADAKFGRYPVKGIFRGRLHPVTLLPNHEQSVEIFY